MPRVQPTHAELAAKHGVTIPYITQIRSMFDKYDDNGDQSLSVEEIARAMAQMGFDANLERISAIVRTIDGDKSGSVEFDEFVDLVINRMRKKSIAQMTQDLARLFHEYDSDKDGLITEDELMAIYKRLGRNLSDSAVHKVFKSVDSNKDGKISLDEFQKALKP